jgi:hypothetical protein
MQSHPSTALPVICAFTEVEVVSIYGDFMNSGALWPPLAEHPPGPIVPKGETKALDGSRLNSLWEDSS